MIIPLGTYTGSDSLLSPEQNTPSPTVQKQTHEVVTELEWLADHKSLELSFDGFGDDDPAWKVHQVTGGRNDREWSLIGSGDTPANALKAARLALNITRKP